MALTTKQKIRALKKARDNMEATVKLIDDLLNDLNTEEVKDKDDGSDGGGRASAPRRRSSKGRTTGR